MKKTNANQKQEITYNKSPNREVKTPDNLYGEKASPTITNIYKQVSTEERIRLYLKICRYVMNGEEI